MASIGRAEAGAQKMSGEVSSALGEAPVLGKFLTELILREETSDSEEDLQKARKLVHTLHNLKAHAEFVNPRHTIDGESLCLVSKNHPESRHRDKLIMSSAE